MGKLLVKHCTAGIDFRILTSGLGRGRTANWEKRGLKSWPWTYNGVKRVQGSCGRVRHILVPGAEGGAAASAPDDQPALPQSRDERAGFNYDKMVDISQLLTNYSSSQVINENRTRPRRFRKIGRNTVEEPGGVAEVRGSPNTSTETRDMVLKIREFFKSRRPLPRDEAGTNARYRPGKLYSHHRLDTEVDGLHYHHEEALREASRLSGEREDEGECEQDRYNRGDEPRISKLQRLQRLKVTGTDSPKAPPPRANIRQNFKPLPPKSVPVQRKS